MFWGPQPQPDSDTSHLGWSLFHFYPDSKNPQNFIHCRASNSAGASSNGPCVGNATAR